MKQFIDKKKNLIFTCFDDNLKNNFQKIMDFLSNKKHSFSHEEAMQELNSWQSDNIKKFVLYSSNKPLGDFLEDKIKKSKHDISYHQSMYYIHQNEALIGVIFFTHYTKAEYPDYLEYIIVNPDYTNSKDYKFGTNIMQSVLDNLDFFTGDKNPDNLICYAHFQNTIARKLFSNLGFVSHQDNSYMLENNSKYTPLIYNVKKSKLEREK